MNKVLADKNIFYTDLENKLENINKELENKKAEENENLNNLVTYQAQDIDSTLKQTKEENVSVIEALVAKEQILKQVFIYVKKYDKMLDRVIPNYNYFINKHEENMEYDDYIETKDIQNWNAKDGK